MGTCDTVTVARNSPPQLKKALFSSTENRELNSKKKEKLPANVYFLRMLEDIRKKEKSSRRNEMDKKNRK